MRAEIFCHKIDFPPEFGLKIISCLFTTKIPLAPMILLLFPNIYVIIISMKHFKSLKCGNFTKYLFKLKIFFLKNCFIFREMRAKHVFSDEIASENRA